MIGRHLARRLLPTGAVLGLLVFAAGCQPLENAPPGGGETLTETFRYGPFTLGPGDDAEGSPSAGMPRPAGDFGLKVAQFDIVEEDGTPVPPHAVHLHHIVMTTDARQDQLCPSRRERFMGSGSERTPLVLWGPYTYLVDADDKWGSLYHVMNTTPPGTPEKTVYIEYTLQYQPGADASNSRPVDPYFQDVTGCGNSTYDIPGDGGPNSVHTKSRSWPAPQDGMAVFSGGHLHKGGIDISLDDSTAGTNFCTGPASYNAHGHLARIKPCLIHEKVKAGNQFTVTSRYDNSKPEQDVMGIMLTYVWWGTQ